MADLITSGLSNITAKIQSGDPANYQNNGGGQSPEDKYASWKEKSGGVKFKQFPPDMPSQRIILVGRDYAFGSAGQQAGFDTIGTAMSGYVLPMPETRLIDTYQINYDSDFSFLNLIPIVGRGSRIEQAARLAGFNLNKFKTVLMEAPMLKRHEFIWKLSPKNVRESMTIRSIVNSLKHDMAPPITGANLLLTFPYAFDIYFDPHFQWMYGFKPSVIESIDVNYAGGNPHPANFINGAPESVIITINLIEMEIWVREDYARWDSAANPVNTLRPSAIFTGNSANIQNPMANVPDATAGIIAGALSGGIQ